MRPVGEREYAGPERPTLPLPSKAPTGARGLEPDSLSVPDRGPTSPPAAGSDPASTRSAPALPEDIPPELRGEGRLANPERLLERLLEGAPLAHERHRRAHALLAVPGQQEFEGAVRRSVDHVRAVLVERLRIGHRVPLLRDEAPRRPRERGGVAVAGPRHALGVEAPEPLVRGAAVALPRRDARHPLAEPEGDPLVRPGPLAGGRLVHHAMGELVGEELVDLGVPCPEPAPRPRRLQVDRLEAGPRAQPLVPLAVDRGLERGVGGVEGDGDFLLDPPPARRARDRSRQRAPDLRRGLGVLEPVVDPEDLTVDLDGVEPIVLPLPRHLGAQGATRGERDGKGGDGEPHDPGTLSVAGAGWKAPPRSANLTRSGSIPVRSRTEWTSGAAAPKPSTGTGLSVWFRVVRSSTLP